MKAKPKILIVDDEKPIAHMLQKGLTAAGYEAFVVYRGEDALQRVRTEPPDLILLDVMMPEMDGYEVCRALKSDARTAIIPIIMTTALSDRKERHEGMAAGADDYLTKPIDSVDLVLRVGNAVRMKSLYDDLQRSYGQLRDLEALRDHLVHLIVHDMRTPLQGILGYLQLLETRADPKGLEYLKQAQASGAMLTRLTDDLLSVHQMENGQIELRQTPATLADIWAEVCVTLAPMATLQEVTFVADIPDTIPPLEMDRDLIRRVLINLVANALKYAPQGGAIEIRTEPSAVLARPAAGDGGAAALARDERELIEWIVVSVQDYGPGIPAEYHEKIFEKFGVVEAMQVGARRSTGLGLTFCKFAVEAHGGRIGVESAQDQGCLFWFALPRLRKPFQIPTPRPRIARMRKLDFARSVPPLARASAGAPRKASWRSSRGRLWLCLGVLALGLGRCGAPARSETPAQQDAGELDRALARKAELEGRRQDCRDDCAPLQALIDDTNAYIDELKAARQAALALDAQRQDAQKERSAADREPADWGSDEMQRLLPAAIEELELKVRLTGLDRSARQAAIEAGLSELTRLRHRQEELAGAIAGTAGPTPASSREAAWLDERRSILQRHRDLAGERIKMAMDSLELERQRLATVEQLLDRLNTRLSGMRLSKGIPAEELERTRARVEQLRGTVLQRAAALEEQQHRIEGNLPGSREQLEKAEKERDALEQARPIATDGAALSEWTRKRATAQDAVDEAQGQIDALGAALDLVRESAHLDEFLLSMQSTELEHDEDFNRLVSLIRQRTTDVGAIEQGLARLQDWIAALSSETQALEVTSEKLRGDIQRASEEIRHTAVRLDAATEEAKTAPPGDTVLGRRVQLIEAILSHQQALSEGLNGRRNLVDEAIDAAQEQLRKDQDSVQLLETYVSGALRFNLGTLSRWYGWLREVAEDTGHKLQQIPGYWLEARLSLQQEHKRARAIQVGTILGGSALGLGLLDWLLARVLRRKRAKLGVRGRPTWLMLSASDADAPPPLQPGAAGPFLMPQPVERVPRRDALRAIVYALSCLHRPLELCGFFVYGPWAVPEAGAAFDALLIGSGIWLVRRLGAVLATLLFSRDPEMPSLRLARRHADFLLRWSFWFLLFWPPVAAAYVAALRFDAPIHPRLSLRLLCLITTLGFALLLLIHGEKGVVPLLQIRSARERPPLPVLLYNRLLTQVYQVALLAVLVVVGLFGAGYPVAARWLGASSLLTAAIITAVAILVRALHVSVRRTVVANPLWGELGGILLHLAEGLLVTFALLAVLVVWGVDLSSLWQGILQQLDREIFRTARGQSIRILSVVWVLALLVLTLWLSRRARELMQRRVFPYLSIDRGQQLSLSLIIHYGLLLLAGLVGLNMLGIDLTTLSVVFGAIGLGVGFGLQTIVNNFVSGLILLFERTIRPDDIIDFGGMRVRVEEVRTRCTVVVDEDNKTWIVPNVRFMNETITNWTQNWAKNRYQLFFYVLPTANIRRLRQVVDQWVVSHPDILPEPKPDFRLSEVQYGALKVGIWFSTTNAWPISRTRSRIYLDLVEMLQREGFQMPLAETRIVYRPEETDRPTPWTESSRSPVVSTPFDPSGLSPPQMMP